MKREVALSIKLGLSVTVTCILTVSDDCLCFRNKLKLSGQQEAPKFATQKMAAYGGSQRLYKESSLLSKMTHEVCISKLACSRLRDGGAPFPSHARLIFALLVLIRSHYTIWEPGTGYFKAWTIITNFIFSPSFKGPGACGQRVLFAAILLCHHVNSAIARWRYICSTYKNGNRS